MTCLQSMPSGSFSIGCNYWASHSGIEMWSNWQPEIIERDFMQLSENSLNVLRIFPLWPEFQPLHCFWKAQTPIISFADRSLGHSKADRAGVSTVAIDKFKILADLAEKCDIKLIVGLLTGWMSGRLFVPPAFESCNALTDPEVIKWEKRFVSYFVEAFKNHPALLAWDLGNECNCMGQTKSPGQSWNWTNTIASAIRLADDSHPVISGMHSLQCESGNWTIFDQSELTDILTTHPYPRFTPKCDQEQVNTIRNGLHATAESLFNSDIGGVPCFPEELGTLGPCICNEQVTAEYLRTTLYSSWAHDCRALLWWCAYDQDHLNFPPYEWNALERELGLFKNTREPKPVVKIMREFQKTIDKLPFKQLPKFETDAICLLTRGQDQWSAAFSSFILGKMAKFNIKFQFIDQPLEDAPLYILPSVSSSSCIYRSEWFNLLEKAKAGATLLVTYDNAFFQPFEKAFGFDILSRERRSQSIEFVLDNQNVSMLHPEAWLKIRPTTAEVLLQDNAGFPLMTHNHYGSGNVFFLNLPLETNLSDIPNVFNHANTQPFWKIYKMVASVAKLKKIINCEHPQLGITEHYLSETEAVVVIINYSPQEVATSVLLAPDWQISEDTDYQTGIDNLITIVSNSCLILHLKKSTVISKEFTKC